MRISPFFLILLFVLAAISGLSAQYSGNPGAKQDAEAAREKLLNAADQIDNIQANSEATKLSVEGMKTQFAQMQTELSKVEAENAGLKQQLADMQTAFDQYKTEQVKSRQALIDNVAGMMADKPVASKTKKKESAETDAPSPSPTIKKTELAMTAPSLAPPPDYTPAPVNATAAPTSTAVSDPPPAPKPQKGYYHVVEKGETLKMICTAYRENGIKVTLADIRKANGLTEKSVLKPGQKLFIPKSGA